MNPSSFESPLPLSMKGENRLGEPPLQPPRSTLDVEYDVAPDLLPWIASTPVVLLWNCHPSHPDPLPKYTHTHRASIFTTTLTFCCPRLSPRTPVS